MTDQEIEKLSTAIAEKLAAALNKMYDNALLINPPQLSKPSTLHMPRKKLP